MSDHQTVTGTLTASGATSAVFYLRPDEVVAVTATFTGTGKVSLSQVLGQPAQAYRPLIAWTTSQSATQWRNTTNQDLYLVLRADRLDAGASVAYTLADVEGDQILAEWYTADGTLAFRITDQGPVGGQAGGTLDVRAFGAVGDGVTDDTVAIQAADAASGPLYFPPGTYRLTSSVTITSGCVFADGATLEPDAGVTVTLSGPVENVGTRVASEDADGWVAVAGQVNGAITTTQPVPLDRRVNYYAFGDSFTAGTGASATAHNYVQILGQAIESTITNRGIGARGVYRAWRELCVYLPIDLRQASLVTLMAGLNDIRQGGTDVKTMLKISHVHRAFIALSLAELVYAANDALVTAAGTWTLPTLVADGLVTKAGTVDVAGTALQAVSGSTLSYTFTADNLVIWPWLSDGVTYEYGPATITIDGTLVETFDPNGLTDGLSDNDNDNGRVPGALVYTGLGSGSHTVVIAPTSATLPFVVDCVGHLAKPQNAQPVIVAGPPYMLAATYGSSAPYDQATPALITDVNDAIRGVCEEFTPWPVKFFRVSDYFDKQNDSDGLHPNDVGYQQIAAGFLAQIRPTLKSAYRGVGSVSTAIGEEAQATGEASMGVGHAAVASAGQALAIGYSAAASQSGAHAIGVGTVASGVSSTAVGYTADATATNAVALGNAANAAAASATALGTGAAATHATAVALGAGAATTAANQVMLGTANETAVAPGHASIGGAAKNVGFYGVTPVARQLLATGAGATVDQVITALQSLGLLRQS